jgi:nitrite reductase/ring-hydroxylating ferredoxin subunit
MPPPAGKLKILLVQDANGEYRALDAHCHHMGASLVEADIEELPTGNCLVCPWHKKRIDMRTGCIVDTDLSGSLCLGHEQQQRTYDVHHDDEHIFVTIPAFSKQLPSDRWNAREPVGYGLASGGMGGYGLKNGAESEPALPPGSPLQPFAGQVRGWPAGSPAPMEMEENVIVVEGSQQSPPPMTQPRRLDFSGPALNSGLASGFGASRRNRAATEAIMKNSYRAPTEERANALQTDGKPATTRQASIREFFVS